MQKSEIRSLSEIAAGSVAQPGATAREVHMAVAGRVFKLLGPLGAPARIVHDGLSTGSYRAVSAALQAPVRAGGRAISERARGSTALADSVPGGLALGALNGVAGDRLARDHPELALGLTVRRRGREVPFERDALVRAFPGATPRIAVFIHGLCGTEDTWRLGSRGRNPSPTYGARLRDELEITPVYVRYNTGLRVSDNGRELAGALEGLVANWPVGVAEISLIGHSMGGL